MSKQALTIWLCGILLCGLASCQPVRYGPSPITMEMIAGSVISSPAPLNATCSVMAFDNQYVPDVAVGDSWGVSYNHTQVGPQLQSIIIGLLQKSNFFSSVTQGDPNADVVLSGYIEKMVITGDYGAGCTSDGVVYYKATFPGQPECGDVTETVHQRDFCPGHPASYGQAMNLVLMKIASRIVNGFFSSGPFAEFKEKKTTGN